MIYYSDKEIKIRSIIPEDIIYLFTWWIDKETNKNDPRPLPNSTLELLQECKWYCERFDLKIET